MADEGASPQELVLEACRRNNVSLLEEVFGDIEKAHRKGGPAEIAKVLNTTRDGLGNGALHVAAAQGSVEAIDHILDQEGVEIDEPNRMDKDTPLHKAVRWTNEGQDRWERGQEMVDMMLDAGCDPRIRNKGKLRPIDLVDPRNTELRRSLQKAEYSIMAGDDVVQDDDGDGAGSGSESD